MKTAALLLLFAMAGHAEWPRYVVTPKGNRTDNPDAHALSYYTNPMLREASGDFCYLCKPEERLAKAQRMAQPGAYRMLRRRAAAAGIKTKVGNHSLRATGITDYLKNNGTEHAQAMANHSSRTTKLYDRRADEVSLDGYGKVGI